MSTRSAWLTLNELWPRSNNPDQWMIDSVNVAACGWENSIEKLVLHGNRFLHVAASDWMTSQSGKVSFCYKSLLFTDCSGIPNIWLFLLKRNGSFGYICPFTLIEESNWGDKVRMISLIYFHSTQPLKNSFSDSTSSSTPPSSTGKDVPISLFFGNGVHP